MKQLLTILTFLLLSNCAFSQAGALDESFDPGYGTDNIFCSSITQILLLDDNRILLSGEYTYYDSVVSRNLTMVDSLGNISNTFSTGQGALGHIEGMELLSNGSGDLYIFGELYNYNGTARNGIARIKPNGVLDQGFVPTDFINSYVLAAEPLSTGKVVVCDFESVMRLWPGGFRDNSFAVTEFNSNVESIESQESKLILGGSFSKLNDIAHGRIGRLNSDGSIDDTFQSGIGFDKAVRKVVVLNNNKIIAVGRFTSYDGNACNGIARLNSDGSFDESFSIGDGFDDDVKEVVILNNNQMLVAGEFSSYQGVSVGGIVRLNADGSIDNTFLSADGTSDGECSFSVIEAVAQNTFGEIYIGGFFNNYNSIPRRNVARLYGSCNSSMTEESISTCGDIELNGVTYSTSGMYNAALTSSYGCDSLVEYNISILPENNQTLNIEICSGLSYEGQTSSGIYEDTYIAVNGCDSTVTVNLTVTAPIENIEQITICNGEEYNGETGTGVYTTIGVDNNGCETLETIELSVLDNISTTRNDIICEGDTLLGYFESGMYTMVLEANNGCDSTVVLDLTVLKIREDSINVSICHGDIYEGYADEGVYIDTYTGSNGCDSIRTLSLSVFSTITSDINMEICNGESYEDYDVSGIYVDTFSSVNGCDSIRTLNLTVLPNSFSESAISMCDDGTSESGSYQTLLVAANGCDSIITIELTVLEAVLSEITDTICQGEVSQGYDVSGVYEDTFTGVNGCDSLRTLMLTVLPLDHSDCDPLSSKFSFIHDVEIYPNPNAGTFSIVGIDKLVHLSLYDLRSNYLLDLDINRLDNIGLPDLVGGVYILRFKHSNGAVSFKKIVIL